MYGVVEIKPEPGKILEVVYTDNRSHPAYTTTERVKAGDNVVCLLYHEATITIREVSHD